MTMNTMPGKRSRADMQGAFEGMHASEDMYEKVMARASHRGRKRGGAPKIAAVATVALAVALAAGRHGVRGPWRGLLLPRMGRPRAWSSEHVDGGRS